MVPPSHLHSRDSPDLQQTVLSCRILTIGQLLLAAKFCVYDNNPTAYREPYCSSNQSGNDFPSLLPLF